MTDIWVCGNCHSINRQRSKNCDKCGAAQTVAATDGGATHRGGPGTPRSVPWRASR